MNSVHKPTLSDRSGDQQAVTPLNSLMMTQVVKEDSGEYTLFGKSLSNVELVGLMYQPTAHDDAGGRNAALKKYVFQDLSVSGVQPIVLRIYQEDSPAIQGYIKHLDTSPIARIVGRLGVSPNSTVPQVTISTVEEIPDEELGNAIALHAMNALRWALWAKRGALAVEERPPMTSTTQVAAGMPRPAVQAGYGAAPTYGQAEADPATVEHVREVFTTYPGTALDLDQIVGLMERDKSINISTDMALASVKSLEAQAVVQQFNERSYMLA